MRKLLILLLLLAVMVEAPAQRRNRQQNNTSQREQLQQRQRRVQQERRANQQRQRQLDEQVRQRMRDVEALASAIDDNRAVIDSLQLSVDSLNSNIAVLDSQLVQLTNELEERRQHYIRSVRYMYRNRHAQNQLMFVLSARSFNQMYRRSRFMNEYTTYQRAQGEAVKQKSEQVAMKRGELETARVHLDTLLAHSQAEQQLMEARQVEQERIVADLQRQQQTVRRLISEQQAEEAELNNQIDRLIAEELERARRAEEERQRQLAQQRQQQQQQDNNNGNRRSRRNNTSGNGNNGTDSYAPADPDRQLSGSFASNKGRMPVPITGSYRVVRNFGPYTMAGVTLQSNGIQLEGADGAQARCIFDGEVSRVYNPGSGYFVMVRHGRYISVYGNLASVTVTAGQHVTTNQILGNVGANHVLIFRLQNWDKVLNPKPWLSKLNR